MAKNKNDLTVVSAVQTDCGGILDLMIESVYKFTNPKPQIILCNQNKEDYLDRYSNDPNITIVNYSPPIQGGSNRHGFSLNKILPMVKTKRTAIVEADCIVLCDGWDSKDRKILAIKKAERPGQILYHAFFMVFDTDLLSGIDFRAGTDKTRASNKPYKMWEDVAWRIDKVVKPDDIDLLTFVDCKSGQGKYFGKEFQSDEAWNGDKAVVSHFGRGANLKYKAVRKNFKHPKDQLEDWKKIAERILV